MLKSKQTTDRQFSSDTALSAVFRAYDSRKKKIYNIYLHGKKKSHERKTMRSDGVVEYVRVHFTPFVNIL